MPFYFILLRISRIVLCDTSPHTTRISMFPRPKRMARTIFVRYNFSLTSERRLPLHSATLSRNFHRPVDFIRFINSSRGIRFSPSYKDERKEKKKSPKRKGKEPITKLARGITGILTRDDTDKSNSRLCRCGLSERKNFKLNDKMDVCPRPVAAPVVFPRDLSRVSRDSLLLFKERPSRVRKMDRLVSEREKKSG